MNKGTKSGEPYQENGDEDEESLEEEIKGGEEATYLP
jgi:hypothetical protein